MLVCYIMRRKWSHARDLRPALPITNRLHRCLCLRGKSNPHGGIRTRTCPILSRMPLLLGYMGKMAEGGGHAPQAGFPARSH